MSVAPPRELKTGVIIDETLGVLERCAVPFLLFIVALAVLNGAIGYYGLEYTTVTQQVLKGVVALTISIAASFFLYEAVLTRTGLRSRQTDDAFFPFVGMAIITALAVMVGLVALVIPGLYLITRWSIAQPLLVGRGTGVMESLGESWERTRGNEFSIIVAALALALAPIVVMIATAVFFEETSPVRIVVTQLASSAMSAIFLGMGVAIYGLMMGGSEPRTLK